MICLNEAYSTTRQVTQEKPVIENQPDDKFKSTLFLPEGEGRQGKGGLRTHGYFKVGLKGKPLITVITVVFNGEKHLEETIQSVINQTYDNVEYIIIDGGSTDNTLDIIKKHEYAIDYWVSEPDEGIGDAWNKGISQAKGELVGLLNADDMYAPDTVKNAIAAYQKAGTNSVIYGVCKFVDNGEIIRVNDARFEAPKTLAGRGFGFVHTTCFVPIEVYKKVGVFSKELKVAVDTDFLVRCMVDSVAFIKSDYLVYMSLGGISDSQAKLGYFEYIKCLFNYNFITKGKYRYLMSTYNFYYPFRGIVKARVLKRTLRLLKHKSIFLYNTLFSWIPTLWGKNIFLKWCGCEIGNHSYILKGTRFYMPGRLILGENSVINRDCLLDNRAKISIGDNVSIAHGSKIYTGGHDINASYFDFFKKEVVIKNHVCIFSNVIIQPGSVLEEGCVILPGSVVSGIVEAYGVYGGVPTKKISSRNKKLLYKIDYPYWDAM